VMSNEPSIFSYSELLTQKHYWTLTKMHVKILKKVLITQLKALPNIECTKLN
jgi:hypothetical protein